MRFVTTKGAAPAVSFAFALFEGIAPDGGLYVPESIPRWSQEELARLPAMTLADAGARVLQPFVDELDADALLAIVEDALSFPIPLVEVEPGIYALELFHGPTLAFKDVGARVMARLMAALFRGDNPLTILVATSGDTGSAVAHAFHDVPAHARGDSLSQGPHQPDAGSAVDDVQRRGDERARVRHSRQLRRLPAADQSGVRRSGAVAARQSDVRQLHQHRAAAAADDLLRACRRAARRARRAAVFSTPSGNFGNLTAGLMAKRMGLPIGQFVAATNVNDVVPEYLTSGRFEPRPSIHTVANAMDVGNPSNFDRLSWLYGRDREAICGDITGSPHGDEEVRATIRKVYDERGYLLDPHSAIAYLGLKKSVVGAGVSRPAPGVFLATAHPAKFAEIVEPVIGRAVEKPRPLVEALATRRTILEADATLGGGREGPWLSTCTGPMC